MKKYIYKDNELFEIVEEQEKAVLVVSMNGIKKIMPKKLIQSLKVFTEEEAILEYPEAFI